MFGQLNIDSEAACAVWPVPATGTVGPSGPPGRRRSWWSAAPATRSRRTAGPSRWRRELANGVLLTRVGDGHTGLRSSSCIRTQVDRYLITLATPPPGTRCPSD